MVDCSYVNKQNDITDRGCKVIGLIYWKRIIYKAQIKYLLCCTVPTIDLLLRHFIAAPANTKVNITKCEVALLKGSTSVVLNSMMIDGG